MGALGARYARHQSVVLACLVFWLSTYAIFTFIDALDIKSFNTNPGLDIIRVKRALATLAGAGCYWIFESLFKGHSAWSPAKRAANFGWAILLAACFVWLLRIGMQAVLPEKFSNPEYDAKWVTVWSGILIAWLVTGARLFEQAGSPDLSAKRLVDIGLASTALLFLAPIMALTAMAIRLNMGRPVLFAQIRPGLHGKPFKLLKFRTMAVAESGVPRPEDDERRMTSLGRFLRSCSLDELPQLWNVIRGDMSLVGPRPLLMHYLPYYTPRQARRHEVRPGITGWAQVNGRNEIDWDRKFELDLWYVQNACLLLDLKILWMTVQAVCSRRGVTPEGSSATPFFVEPKE